MFTYLLDFFPKPFRSTDAEAVIRELRVVGSPVHNDYDVSGQILYALSRISCQKLSPFSKPTHKGVN